MANINDALRVEGLSLNDSSGLFSGSNDPVLGEVAPPGSLFLRDNGELYLKSGVLDTDWKIIATTADAQAVYNLMGEPTGFPNRTDTTLAVNEGTRTFTIAPSGATYDYYINGIKYTISSPIDTVFPNSEGMHYFYLDENESMIIDSGSPTIPELIGNAYCCALYWSVDTQKIIYAADERHGLTMDGQTHLHFHTSIGTQYISGLGLNSVVLAGGGAAAADAQFGVDDGVIRDEDLAHNIVNGVAEAVQTTSDLEQILNAPATIPVLYRTGATGEWAIKDADTFPLIYSGQEGYTDGVNGLPPYNEFTGATWTFTPVPDGQYVLVHYVATNDWRHPIMAIQGTTAYPTKPHGFGEARTELYNVVGMPFTEYVPIASIIYKCDSTYSNTPKVTVAATDEGDSFVDWRGLEYSTIFGGTSINDHSNLSGLSDDDHTIYHTDARGDARYYTQAQVDAAVATKDESTEITIPYVTGAAYTDLQSHLDFFHSSGVVKGGELTDNLDGTITVAAGFGFVRLIDDRVSELQAVSWNEWTTPVLTIGIQYYVEVTVTAGLPVVYLAATVRPSCNVNIHLGELVRDTTRVHRYPAARFDIGDHARAMLSRLQETNPFQHASGASIGESGTRNITLTSGKFWHGLTDFTTLAYDTSNGDTFDYYWRDSFGGWNETLGATQISNTLYDDADGTLGTLTPGNYGVHWVYIMADHGIAVIYGRGDYTLIQAQDATSPADLPLQVSFHARLVGKIIIFEGAASFTSVQSAFTEVLSPSSVTDHNNLLNIGANTHAQIDAHIADITTNPHDVTLALLNDVNPAMVPVAGHQLYYDQGNTRWDSAVFFASGSKQILQEVNGKIGKFTGTSQILLSASAPLIADGTQIISQAITPAAASTEITIDLSFLYSAANSANPLTIAVFRDTTAIGATVDAASGNNQPQAASHVFKDVGPFTPGVPVTYTVRVGNASGTSSWYIGQTSGFPTLFADLPLNAAYRIQEIVVR